MRGFNKTALILFPKEETVKDMTPNYKRKFQKRVTNIIRFLSQHSMIQPVALETDDVVAYNLCNLSGVSIQKTLTDEDRNFVRNNVEGYENTDGDLELNEVLITEAREKFPLTRGLRPEQRLQLILKRTNYITGELIKHSRVVFNLDIPVAKVKQYNSRNDRKADRVVYTLDHSNGILNCYYSGDKLASPSEFTQVSFTDTPIEDWEV